MKLVKLPSNPCKFPAMPLTRSSWDVIAENELIIPVMLPRLSVSLLMSPELIILDKFPRLPRLPRLPRPPVRLVNCVAREVRSVTADMSTDATVDIIVLILSSCDWA